MADPWDNPDPDEPQKSLEDVVEDLLKKIGKGFQGDKSFLIPLLSGALALAGILTSVYTVEPSEEAVILHDSAKMMIDMEDILRRGFNEFHEEIITRIYRATNEIYKLLYL